MTLNVSLNKDGKGYMNWGYQLKIFQNTVTAVIRRPTMYVILYMVPERGGYLYNLSENHTG